MKKRLIALVVTALVMLMTPFATMAYGGTGGDDAPIRPYPTRTTITIEAEEDC